MHYLRRTLTALAALAFLTAAPAAAQSSDDGTIQGEITLIEGITVSPAQNITWPSVFAGNSPVFNDQMGVWDVSADTGLDVAISASVPSALTDGSGNSVPLAYGTSSLGTEWCDTDGDGTGEVERVDPTAAAPQIASCITAGPAGDGVAQVTLGRTDGTDALKVEADPSSAPAGTYTGDMVLTVTVN